MLHESNAVPARPVALSDVDLCVASRGFETITIAFEGSVEHGDSVGNSDIIHPGDVQWMTAGRGIIHEEYHSSAFAKHGGTFEMCQLWLNLPAEHKMHAPRYQPILNANIPTVALRAAATAAAAHEGAPACEAVDSEGDNETDLADGARGVAGSPSDAKGSARVIAGELDGTVGPATTFSPVELFDISLPRVSELVELSLPAGHTALLFVRKGELAVGGGAGSEDAQQVVGAQGVALMEKAGSVVRMAARKVDTQVLLLGGAPLNEPIAARGPFVMNTEQELMQANLDFRSGRMGR